MSWKTKTFASFVSALAALSEYAAPSRSADSPDPSRFTYARLYCGPDGNTHFQNVTAELRKTDFAPPAPPVHIGSDFPASRAFLGGFDAKWGAHDLGPGNPTQPSYARDSVRHCPAGDLFHHHDRWRDTTPHSRQRVSVGGHFALQGTHHGRRRPAWIPDVRSVRRTAQPRAASAMRGTWKRHPNDGPTTDPVRRADGRSASAVHRRVVE
jgi:hypothetical protein